jgi:hypothetical protein
MRIRKKYRIYFIVLILAFAISLVIFFQQSKTKPIILYVNQGNGRVDESNFDVMLSFAKSHQFNTIFFQIYREGKLLFNSTELKYFVTHSHSNGLSIFFSFYITSTKQVIPDTAIGLGEDGINLDMSILTIEVQQSLINSLRKIYHNPIAVTTNDMNYPLKPDIIVLETYYPELTQYIRHGIIASVGAFTTSSYEQYKAELEYALSNSDGVMVFDYAALVKKGY